jgi:NAD(P)H-dependent FMN reductase
VYDTIATLPAFNPDADIQPLDAEVQRLRDAIHDTDAILFCTPEYAGALPGALKNLLDWTIGDDQPGSIYEKPVGWVDVSPRGASGAYGELRTVLGYAHARIIESACAQIPITGAMIGPAGLVEDETTRGALSQVLVELLSPALKANNDRPREPS